LGSGIGTATSVGAPRTREVDVRPQSYWKTGDQLPIVTLITVGIGDEVIVKTLREDSGSVRVCIRVREVTETKPALGIVIVAVTLRQPLGDRVVQDSTGRVVPEIEAPRYGAPRSRISTDHQWAMKPELRVIGRRPL